MFTHNTLNKLCRVKSLYNNRNLSLSCILCIDISNTIFTHGQSLVDLLRVSKCTRTTHYIIHFYPYSLEVQD